jgi:hypothetical protein
MARIISIYLIIIFQTFYITGIKAQNNIPIDSVKDTLKKIKTKFARELHQNKEYEPVKKLIYQTENILKAKKKCNVAQIQYNIQKMTQLLTKLSNKKSSHIKSIIKYICIATILTALVDLMGEYLKLAPITTNYFSYPFGLIYPKIYSLLTSCIYLTISLITTGGSFAIYTFAIRNLMQIITKMILWPFCEKKEETIDKDIIHFSINKGEFEKAIQQPSKNTNTVSVCIPIKL